MAEPVVMINTFTVFEGKEDAFLELWDQTNAIFAAAPGYIDVKLVQARAEQPPGQTANFTHINVATWASASAYESALQDPRLRKLAGAYLKVCTLNPALYEILRQTPSTQK